MADADRSTEDQTDLVALGVVTKPHGVRGEVRVHPYNKDSDLLLHLDEVLLRGEEEVTTCGISAARRGPKGVVLCRLEGSDSYEIAESLRGVELCIPRAALPPAEQGEWYHVDLVGLTALDETAAPDAGPLGEVMDVIDYPSVDVLVVRWADDGAFSEVPLVDAHVGAVDLEAGTVVLRDWADLPRLKRQPK